MAEIFTRLLKQMAGQAKAEEDNEGFDEVESSSKNFFGSATYADIFGMICTVLSCTIAGYQIMQHLRYYT